MASSTPLFRAVTSSARQLFLLLRCIAFAKTAQVRITSEGIRFTTEESSVMEAFVLLEKKLFTTYHHNASPYQSLQDDLSSSSIFEISLTSLLETLNVFNSSDPNVVKRPNEYEPFAAHRLSRHAGINAFSNHALGLSGVCTFVYDGEGCPLSIHMSEGGVTTTCELTTYDATSIEEIPFDRDAIGLKAVMRSSYLLDATNELSSMSPTIVSIAATPTSRRASGVSLSASGALGSVTVDFTTNTPSDTPILETFLCNGKAVASFRFNQIKSAQRAMASSTKVSMRLDDEGVLSLQFMVEIEAGPNGGEDHTFVDFRIVPLIEDEADQRDSDEIDED